MTAYSQPHSSQPIAEAIVADIAHYVDDVVICPGSRNSALSLALIARPDVRVHVRIDERSAAFLAVGIARVTKRHVGVVTTSGTAVANCLPAVLEAQNAHIPLAIISADRPDYLVGTGANQTIEQRGLLGLETYDIADQHDLGDVFQHHQQVHINVRLAAPLVEGLPQPPQPVVKIPTPTFIVDHGETTIDLSRRTLVIAGGEAWEVPGLEDVPTVPEPTAPAPYHPVHPLAVQTFTNEYAEYTKPEHIIVVGHPTLSRDIMELVADNTIELTILSKTTQVTNPWRRNATIATRVRAMNESTADWIRICAAATDVAIEKVRTVLADEIFGFTGLHVAAAVADSLSTNDYAVFGASNPIRDASLVGLPFQAVDTFSPRGVAGIDGTTSQIMGIALAAQAQHPTEIRAPRTLALIGDVTFLHDVGGLLTPENSPLPENLTIVVANDNGCGIFHALEVGDPEFQPSFEQAFGTPHNTNIAALCDAYGLEYQQVTTLPDLILALDDAAETTGLRVIEAVTTRTTRAALHHQLSH